VPRRREEEKYARELVKQLDEKAEKIFTVLRNLGIEAEYKPLQEVATPPVLLLTRVLLHLLQRYSFLFAKIPRVALIRGCYRLELGVLYQFVRIGGNTLLIDCFVTYPSLDLHEDSEKLLDKKLVSDAPCFGIRFRLWRYVPRLEAEFCIAHFFTEDLKLVKLPLVRFGVEPYTILDPGVLSRYIGDRELVESLMQCIRDLRQLFREYWRFVPEHKLFYEAVKKTMRVIGKYIVRYL